MAPNQFDSQLGILHEGRRSFKPCNLIPVIHRALDILMGKGSGSEFTLLHIVATFFCILCSIIFRTFLFVISQYVVAT